MPVARSYPSFRSPSCKTTNYRSDETLMGTGDFKEDVFSMTDRVITCFSAKELLSNEKALTFLLVIH